MDETTVISVRGRNRDELLVDLNFVYVGRAMPRAGWRASIFANPYTIAQYKALAVPCFKASLEAGLNGLPVPGSYPKHFELIARALPELRGKTLGC